MAQSCTYTFNGPDGKEVTIRGMAAMKAYLVDGGMEFFQTKGVRFEGLEKAEAKPADKEKTLSEQHEAVMASVREGKATPEEFKASFEQVVSSEEAIKAELSKKTKSELLREGGWLIQMRYANDKKDAVVDAVYRQMIGEYALSETVSYGMGPNSYQNAVRRMVDATDADKLAQYVKDLNAAIAEAEAQRAARAEGLANPKTLNDFRSLLNLHIREGKTRKEAFLMLTPEQRIQYDTLEAEGTREAREARKRAAKTEVRTAGQATSGQIIATKHTRDGYDLFVVQLSDRLGVEDYKTVLAGAKRLGGWYSSFRGNGATPGFQFKTREDAEAFLQLAGGDTTAAKAQAAQRRDAFEDDRSQTAAQRLGEMADRLEDSANEELNRDRKANTARRARFAQSALDAAESQKAMAKTMRNIAGAIEAGKAKFLDAVRTKSQVEMLAGLVRTAKDNELRAKYDSYAEQQKRKGERPTAETADFAEFPSFTAFRSDLASLGRQLLDVEGTKKLGQKIMSVADDVTDAYLDFAKSNILSVSRFGRGDGMAEFSNRDDAEKAIRRSGLTGRAIVLQVKRGQNRVILSPSEAMNIGIWKGDGDKRITLTGEFGSELVEAIGRRGNKQNRLSVPWQFQNAYDRRKALARIGIETPSEFRSALREFIDLQETATANKVRALELSMVGNKKDGLDFFPTPAEIADQMVEAADIKPEMAVLEPSAGMGHIADRIREAGAEPDVIEMSGERRELLQEKGYNLSDVTDFMDLKPREVFTYGDIFRAPDGKEGALRGLGSMGSQRVQLVGDDGNAVGYYDRDQLTPVRHAGYASGYDRIIMNPPFSNRRDAAHVQHAYTLLRPGGRIVAIMGEGVFFGQDKRAQEFRDWLESVGGTSEKLPDGSFMDPSLPVNTGVNARMVVIDKPASGEAPSVLRATDADPSNQRITRAQADGFLSGFLAKYANAPQVTLVNTFDQLPATVQQEARNQGGNASDTKGVFHRGQVYLVAGNHSTVADFEATVFHEVIGHAGVRALFGDDFVKTVNRLFMQLGGQAGLVKIMQRRGMGQQASDYIKGIAQAQRKELDKIRADMAAGKPGAQRRWNDAIARFVLTEEVFAHIAEQVKDRPSMMDKMKELIGKIRQWLRDKGFAELSNLGETDILFMLSKARQSMQGKDGGNITRNGVTVSGNDLMTSDGRRLNKDDPDYASAMRLADLLGLRQEPGVTTFRNEPEGDMPAVLSRAPSATQQQARDIRDKLANTFRAMTGDTARTFNWWNRTIGSQYNKAKKSPEFKKVYDRAHDFIDDVSRFANEAADRARNILPHLDTWKDIGAGLNVRKAWADAKDYQAIAPAIFEGTLANGTTGKVWSDEELSSRFNLNEKQKGLYREFRDAVNFSLDTLAKSEMTRAARAAKLEAAESNLSLDDTLAFYVRQVDDQIAKVDALVDAVKKQHAAETEAFMKEFGDKLQSGRYRKAVEVMVDRQNAELEAAEKAGEGLDDLRKSFTDKSERIQQLKDEGYAPLMRFGQYTVDVVKLDENGEPVKSKGGEQDRPFFGMFESEAEAREAARILQEEYPDYTVTRGVLSDKSNELFKGVTPETAELFAKMLGTSETEGFQAYLKQAVANRSAMKRLIERKGMEGFSTDVPRVLASFITSNARLSSGNLHFGEMAKAVADIPKTKGDVADEAIKLMQYIQNPQEEAAALRGLLFFNFLGGSVAAALVNTTQTVTTTLPYLNQFGARNAASAISKATIAAANVMRKPGFDGVQDKALRDALQRASEEGIIDPQEIHLLMAESMGNGASSLAGRVAGMVNKDLQVPVNRFTRSLTQAWGGLFSVAEKYNRHVAFMAAWDVAGKMTPEQLEKAGAKDRFDFAKQAVIETQFEYNKVNRPNWARGAVGATLFTFKTFLVNYMEFIKRLPSREKALAVGVLLLLSGMSGAPGADDLDDLIDSIGQKLGYNWNNKAGRHAWLMETFGKDATNFIEHGVSSFLPIDVSARLGMGNIIPGTGIFKKSSDDKGRDAAEFFGPAGSLAKGAMTVFDDLGTGKPLGELVRPVMPKAYNDAYQAIDVAQTGYYRDSKGRKVVEADTVDALAKAIGFQPNAVAEPRRVEFMLAQSANMVRVMRADIHELWARGVAEGDREKVQAAQDMLREWNEKNRETPIRPNLQSIQQRVRAMRLSSAERLVKATPKEMRGMVSASLVAE